MVLRFGIAVIDRLFRPHTSKYTSLEKRRCSCKG